MNRPVVEDYLPVLRMGRGNKMQRAIAQKKLKLEKEQEKRLKRFKKRRYQLRSNKRMYWHDFAWWEADQNIWMYRLKASRKIGKEHHIVAFLLQLYQLIQSNSEQLLQSNKGRGSNRLDNLWVSSLYNILDSTLSEYKRKGFFSRSVTQRVQGNTVTFYLTNRS